MFARWARLMGREDLIDDPRCIDDITRADNHDLINRVMSEWCAARTQSEVMGELERARIPCGPVYSLDEVMNDPQVSARELLEPVEYPGAPAPIPLAASPVRLSGSVEKIRRRAPELGEHTDEVLRELGFTPGEIAEFRDLGVV
jgi:crotonobetainyl-CoA:carnitine CoA-transferase CaiB-like acyl-CoA transferase